MQLLSFYNWVMATATTSTGVKGGAATGHVSWDLEGELIFYFRQRIFFVEE
jgi:hypothetical protein